MNVRRLGLMIVTVVAGLAWSGRARAAITVAPGSASINNQPVATTGTTDFKLSNSAGADVSVLIVKDALNCTNGADLSISVPTGGTGTVPGNGDLTTTVSFTPQTRGAQSCQFNVRNAGNTSTLTSFTVTATAIAAVSTLSQTTLGYGSVRANGVTKSLSFTISNGGDPGQVLTINSITLGGANPGDYSITAKPADGTMLTTADPAVTVTVQFDPTTTGPRPASVIVTTTDPVNSPQTVTLTGTGTSAVISLPASDTFTSVTAGTTQIHNIAVGNTGSGANLSVTSAALTSTGGTWITFANSPAGTPSCAGTKACAFTSTLLVGPGSTQNVQVQCAPPIGSTGTQLEQLTFTSDTDPGGSVMTTVSCTAVKPDISISPATLAHDFGNVHIGTTVSFGTLVITNAGGANLSFTIARQPGGTPADFKISGPNCNLSNTSCTTTLVGGAAATYAIAFTPAAQGDRSAVFRITSNDQDPADQQQDFAVTGVGTQATLGASPASGQTLAFGSQTVGTDSTAQTVTATNNGNEDLTISLVTFAGADFKLVSGSLTPPPITPGSSASWQIACHPNSRGNKVGSITIANSSTNTPGYVVNFTCKGIGPDLSVDQASIDFGTVREDTSQSKVVTITNNGEQTAVFGTSTLLPANLGYTFSGLPATIAGNGGKGTVTITFSPTAGVDGGAATLSMPSNAVNSPTNVAIKGIGQPYGVSVTCTGPQCTNNVDFTAGNVRWDKTLPVQYTITNTGDATVSINGIALTATTNFTMSGVPATPFQLAGGASKSFTVTADPNDTTLGSFTATLQVQTDLPPPQMLIQHTVSVTSVSPALTILPGMTVDFGAFDLEQTTAKTMTVTLQNTGAAAMDLGTVASFSGRFASAGVAGKSVAAGSQATFDVAFLPTTETTATDPTNAQIVHVSIAGLIDKGLPQPSDIQIQLTGYGADRHIEIPDSPVNFPTTYDHPTDLESPGMICTVKNNGDEPLVISAVSLGGNAPEQFQLSGGPMTIPGRGKFEYGVKFLPTKQGGPFEADVTFTHDDDDVNNGTGVSTCHLTGSAMGRVVNFMPNPVDLGVTGVGVPVHFSDRGNKLQLVNKEGHDFAVTGLAFASGDVDQFQLIDMSNNKTLGANGSLDYDIEFAPDHAGTFTAMLNVHLDGSPDAVAQVAVKGTAVDVHFRGGGCGAAGGGAGGGALVLVAIAAIGLRRRRRGAASATLFVVVIAGAGVTARADTSVTARNFELGTFAPAPTTEVDGFQVESARVGVSGAFALGLVLDQATNPLHAEAPGAANDMTIKSRSAAELALAYAFAGRFEAGVRVPMIAQSGDKMATFSGVNGPSVTALGDVALHLKAQLFDAGLVALAASTTVTLPTHSSDQFVGAGPSGHLAAILGVRTGRVGAAVNAGLRLRGTTSLGDINQGNAVTYGVGASYRVMSALSVIGELFGQTGVSGAQTAADSPLEWIAGARYRLGGGLDVAFGGGHGILHGIGSPDWRGFVQLTYAPRAREPEPLPGDRPVPPRPRDTRDDDGDGIVNADDQCPSDPEDKDGFQDGDGCPDPDNDGDGIPDAVDKCVNEPEDKDGFQDEDGCPDLDNDGDGIPDAVDKCPNEPEDKDGFQDNDGCDDPDNDHDGIPDIVDQCATEPETINGINDDDGCPDQGDSSVMVQADRIEIFEPIVFAGQTANLDKKSTNVLSQVAATLRANPEFVRVRVTVHVQPRGGGDEDLTDRRAEAVRAWLIKRGIEPERLESKGMGSSRPLVPKGQKGAAAINDRVEFIIMDKR